jgi:hypothetical protein
MQKNGKLHCGITASERHRNLMCGWLEIDRFGPQLFQIFLSESHSGKSFNPWRQNSSVDAHQRIHTITCIKRKDTMTMIHQRSSNRLLLPQRGYPALNSSPRGKSLLQRNCVLCCLLAILLVFSPSMARAQELAATLMGVVSDTSGAVIPNASITIELNGVNGATRVVKSDGAGNYTAPNLTAGTYSITAVAEGFATYKGKNIILNVADKHTVNIQLKAGSISTTVTVEDNPVSVDTESSSQAGTISGTQVRELELSSRNFEQLVTLQPGVVNSLGDEATAGSTTLAINGARTTANNWTVDGADINDSGSNGTVVSTPSIDAIQEFTLQRGSYDAGYGRSGGGQVLVATKNGTSTFHGNMYEFVRNTVFDANDYFSNLNGDARAANHHNVYGFTLGGPLYIPKIYNTDKKKTFFFWSEEWHKVTAPGSDSMPAATSAQLAGTISGQFTPSGSNGLASGCLTYDAATNTTQISSSCYSANAKVYLSNVFSKYPANSNGNYNFNYSSKNNLRDDIVRVDHYFNDRLHFYARGMNDDMPVNYPEGLWAGSNYPGLTNTMLNSPGKNVVGNLTWTISPKVVNELEFVWSQGSYSANIVSGQFATSSTVASTLTNNWAYSDPYNRLPAVTITGVTGFTAGSAPYTERNLDRTYFDNLAITVNKHTLRLGFQIQQMLKTENGTGGNPNFSFNSWGDYLLGNVSSYSQASRDIVPNLHYVNSEAYIQDDWKVSQKLTINMGVRWSRFPSATDVNNTLVNFDPLLYSSLLAPAIDASTGDFVAGQSAGGFSLQPATYANGLIFPKGEACASAQAISSQVQCSPYGRYVNPNSNANFGPRLGFAYNPDGRGITSFRGGFGIFYDRVMNGIWENNAFTDPPLAQTTTVTNGSFDAILGGTQSVSYGPNALVSTGTPFFKVPNYANFNLSVQRQLLPTTTLEVAYVGNMARHLLGEFDSNQPTVSAWKAAAGGSTSTTNVNAIRPFKGYAKITDRAPLFTNNYSSLQVSMNHRSSKGLTVGIAYTWSKDMTTDTYDRSYTVTDSHDFKHDYGPSSTNTPHIFEANYIYDLPFYKQQHGLKGKVLGGWEVSGITSMVSGTSFSLSQPRDPFDPDGVNVGLGLGATRPDQISKVHMLKKRTEWFSTDSFAKAVGHFGNESSNSLLGPGLQNWDLATIKNLKFADRYTFQLRGEYFNAFNHTNFSDIDTSMGDSTFGQATSTHKPRRIQIGAKLNF